MDEISHFPFSIIFRNIFNFYRIWYSILRVLKMWLFNNEMKKKILHCRNNFKIQIDKP